MKFIQAMIAVSAEAMVMRGPLSSLYTAASQIQQPQPTQSYSSNWMVGPQMFTQTQQQQTPPSYSSLNNWRVQPLTSTAQQQQTQQPAMQSPSSWMNLMSQQMNTPPQQQTTPLQTAVPPPQPIASSQPIAPPQHVAQPATQLAPQPVQKAPEPQPVQQAQSFSDQKPQTTTRQQVRPPKPATPVPQQQSYRDNYDDYYNRYDNYNYYDDDYYYEADPYGGSYYDDYYVEEDPYYYHDDHDHYDQEYILYGDGRDDYWGGDDYFYDDYGAYDDYRREPDRYTTYDDYYNIGASGRYSDRYMHYPDRIYDGGQIYEARAGRITEPTYSDDQKYNYIPWYGNDYTDERYHHKQGGAYWDSSLGGISGGSKQDWEDFYGDWGLEYGFDYHQNTYQPGGRRGSNTYDDWYPY